MSFLYDKKRVVLLLLAAFWCVVIFMLSAENADDSSQTSRGLIEAVCEWIVPDFDDFTGNERAEFIESLQFAVRKCAHFTAYSVLGILSWSALYDMKKRYRYACAVGFGFVYACSDEIHQLFVPERSGEFRDVLIDTSGAMLGTLIALGATVLLVRMRKRRDI